MKKLISTLLLIPIITMLLAQGGVNDSIPVDGKWSVEKITNWYNEQPWLVGCNYYPATAPD